MKHENGKTIVVALYAVQLYLVVPGLGRKRHIENIVLVPDSFTELGGAVYAEFGLTKFGCRLYEIAAPRQNSGDGVKGTPVTTGSSGLPRR